jgi:hypothetical protein
MGVFYAEFGAIMREFFGKHIYKCLTFPKTAYIALFCHFSASQKPKPTLLGSKAPQNRNLKDSSL